MTRETPREAILRHSARGMRRSQIEAIYGMDSVLAVLGSERPAQIVQAGPPQFAERLKAARHAERLSIPVMAKHIGIAVHDLEAMEAGQTVPRAPARIIKLAQFMGEDPYKLTAELLQGQATPKAREGSI